MAFPVAFKDQGKNASDLLVKGFPASDKDKFLWKIELDTTSSNKIQFQSYLSHPPDSAPQGEIKSKFTTHDIDFLVKGNTKDELSLEATPGVIKGIKPTITLSSLTTAPRDNITLKTDFEVRKDFVHALLTATVPFTQGEEATGEEAGPSPKVNLAGVVGSASKGVSVGVNVECNIASRQVSSVHSFLAYANSYLEVTGFWKMEPTEKSEFGVNYYQKLENKPVSAVGAELSYDQIAHKSPSLALGALFKPDSTCSVKTRLNSKGFVGVSYTQQMGGPFTVSLGGDINVLNLQKSPAQFAAKLTIK
jgi:hypothetical protein